MRWLGWQQVSAWRLAVVAGVAGVGWMVGFYAGPALRGVVIDWTEPIGGFVIVRDVRVWLGERGPIDLAFAFSGLLLTVGASWARRSYLHERSVVKAPPVFGAIPRPALWFQARPDVGRALEPAMRGRGRPAVVALLGARGNGKSQLAAVYARRCVRRYQLVAWVNAERGLVDELALLGDQLGLRTSSDQSSRQLATSAMQAVSMAAGPSLLVFDNVDDPDDLRGFLPATGTGKVLITSRRREISVMPAVTTVEVGIFTPTQGRDLLKAATGRPDDDDAFRVGESLGWLPLAVAQAAAYITLNRITYQQYLDRLDRADVDEALTRQAGAAHVGVLQSTRLSLDLIDHLDTSGNGSRLLMMLSMLAPEGIHRVLLVQPEGLAKLSLTTAAAEHALALLANTSLIVQAAPGDPGGPVDTADATPNDPVIVAVHRLTARIVRYLAARSRPDDYDQAVAAAAAILETATDNFPSQQAVLRRPELNELVAHILALRDSSRHRADALDRLADWAANCLSEVGDYSRAIDIHEILAVESEQRLGPDHADTLRRRDSLAETYVVAGRDSDALRLFEQTLTDRERILGADHRDTLTSRNDVASVYLIAGRHADGIPLLERNLADRERVLGIDDHDTLMSRNNLAEAYRLGGHHDQAIGLHERGLFDRERVLGIDDPDTMMSRNNLAASYWLVGRYDDAIPLFERTAADRERILGTEHPNTLLTRNNLSAAYRTVGRYDDAIQLLRRNLAVYARFLKDDHPDVLLSRLNLADCYRLTGRHDEAIALHERVQADYQTVYGPTHPATLRSRNLLALAHRDAGRYDDAIRLLESTLTDRELVLGAEHPDTVASRGDLAATYRAAGRPDEADRVLPGT